MRSLVVVLVGGAGDGFYLLGGGVIGVHFFKEAVAELALLGFCKTLPFERAEHVG